jgi:hypothetical protein
MGQLFNVNQNVIDNVSKKYTTYLSLAKIPYGHKAHQIYERQQSCSFGLILECPVFSVRVGMRETGQQGSEYACGKKHALEQVLAKRHLVSHQNPTGLFVGNELDCSRNRSDRSILEQYRTTAFNNIAARRSIKSG